MDVWDLIKEAVSLVEQARASAEGHPPEPHPTPPPAEEHPTTPVAAPQTVTMPDRQGTFLIPDIYPDDLGPRPPFQALPGMHVDGKEVVGCYLKASEGTGWSGEAWFEANWPRLRALAGSTFFCGAYHFLRFAADGAAQADYFCELVDRAGGLGEWGLMPWVDVEEGGQGRWAPGRLANLDPTEKARLAEDVRKVTSDFIARVKQRWPGARVGLYGRSIFRDLGIRDAHLGQDAVCNPGYTPKIVPMDAFGIPLSEIVEWQLCGDGEVYVPGYPHELPGWGRTDYSVVIDGANPTTLSTVRRRCLARPVNG